MSTETSLHRLVMQLPSIVRSLFNESINLKKVLKWPQLIMFLPSRTDICRYTGINYSC